MDSTDVKAAATRAGNNRALELTARIGYALNGVLHVLLGVIALQLAWFSRQASVDQSGALGTLSDNPVGKVVLWVAVLGWLGLAIWQLSEAVGGVRSKGDRVKAVAKTVVYLALSWTAFSFATGSGKSSKSQTRDFTATLMTKPAGQWLVGLVGVIIIGIAVYHVYKGWKRTFLRDLEEHPGRWIERAGRFGYIAKGVALGIVGFLFVIAAVRHNPSEAGGLDTALRNLLGAPGGQLLLTIVALGLIAYGIYSFGRARHARV
jgi:type IV secretory pathway VirB2 component (pilin)